MYAANYVYKLTTPLRRKVKKFPDIFFLIFKAEGSWKSFFELLQQI